MDKLIQKIKNLVIQHTADIETLQDDVKEIKETRQVVFGGAVPTESVPQQIFASAFEDLANRWTVTIGGGGSATTDTQGLDLKTSITVGSFAKAVFAMFQNRINFSRKSTFVTGWDNLVAGMDNAGGCAVVGDSITVGATGVTLTPNHYGFEIEEIAGVIKVYATNADGVTQTRTEIGATHSIENAVAIFNPGVDVKFYIDGVLKIIHTTNLPTGAYTDITFGLSNKNNADDGDIQFGSCSFSQNAY